MADDNNNNNATAAFFARKERKYKPFDPNRMNNSSNNGRKEAAGAAKVSAAADENPKGGSSIKNGGKQAANTTTFGKPPSSHAAVSARPTTDDDCKPKAQEKDGMPLCRFYVLHGNCRYGENCRFSHTLPEGQNASKQIACPYFLQGNCRYGDSCRLRHDEADRPELTCGICLGDMSGQQFGLLSNCDHLFCLDCLRKWRSTKSGESDTRTCPTCRQPSDFVVPSYKFCTGAEKQFVIQNYKAHLATLPCKNFTGEFGSCMFGRECFYAHLDYNGNDVKEQDEPRRQPRQRMSAMEELTELFAFFMFMELIDDFDQDSEEEEEEEDIEDSFEDDEDIDEYTLAVLRRASRRRRR